MRGRYITTKHAIIHNIIIVKKKWDKYVGFCISYWKKCLCSFVHVLKCLAILIISPKPVPISIETYSDVSFFRSRNFNCTFLFSTFCRFCLLFYFSIIIHTSWSQHIFWLVTCTRLSWRNVIFTTYKHMYMIRLVTFMEPLAVLQILFAFAQHLLISIIGSWNLLNILKHHALQAWIQCICLWFLPLQILVLLLNDICLRKVLQTI